MKNLRYFLPLAVLFGFAVAGRPAPPAVDADTPVETVLSALGAPVREDTRVRQVAGASAELGRQIVVEGKLADGRDQSPHFNCTSCHNVVREDPVLTTNDPEARLAYAVENDLPFLPATTLWGAVNRQTYYNGDYEQKYGELVDAARDDLRGAIQLCATECSQGRALDEVEMESVVAYLHTIGLKLGDLPESAPSVARINAALSESSGDKAEVIDALRATYSLASPATFVSPPEDRRAGYPTAATPDPERGGAIFERSCLHCHGGQRYSFFLIEPEEEHYRFLTKHLPRYTRYSAYQVIRYGTSPIPGKRAYMPQYTRERMSDLQVEDLRAFLARGPAR